MRRPDEIVQVNLRLRESFRLQLEREAKNHGVSFRQEVLNRLESSFEADMRRDLEDIAQDMMVCWSRYSQRFLLLELEQDLATALAKSTDPEVAVLAKAWLAARRTRGTS